MTPALRRFIFCGAMHLSASGCPTATSPHDAEAAPPAIKIDAARARKLALERYRELSRNLYLRNHRTGEYIAFEPLDERDFDRVEPGPAAWSVVADPSAGWIVHARVSNAGDWVEITHLGYSDY